eukprot:280829_1
MGGSCSSNFSCLDCVERGCKYDTSFETCCGRSIGSPETTETYSPYTSDIDSLTGLTALTPSSCSYGGDFASNLYQCDTGWVWVILTIVLPGLLVGCICWMVFKLHRNNQIVDNQRQHAHHAAIAHKQMCAQAIQLQSEQVAMNPIQPHFNPMANQIQPQMVQPQGGQGLMRLESGDIVDSSGNIYKPISGKTDIPQNDRLMKMDNGDIIDSKGNIYRKQGYVNKMKG